MNIEKLYITVYMNRKEVKVVTLKTETKINDSCTLKYFRHSRSHNYISDYPSHNQNICFIPISQPTHLIHIHLTTNISVSCPFHNEHICFISISQPSYLFHIHPTTNISVSPKPHTTCGNTTQMSRQL